MNRNSAFLKNPGRIIGGIALFSMFFAIIVCALLSAVAYDTADKASSSSEAHMKYTANYYSCETLATEILTGTANELYSKSITSDTRTVYSTPKGEIEVLKTADTTSFEIPVNKSKTLNVTAVTDDDSIEIVQWTVKNIN